MKRANLFLILISLILAGGIAYASTHGKTIVASGPDQTETRSTPTFSELEVSNAIEVIYTVGSKTKVTVTAPQSIMPYVRTDVSNGTLSCKLKGNDNDSFNFGNNSKVVINITAPALKEFDISGASKVKVTNAITGLTKLEIDLSGASNMEIGTAEASTIDIELSGASKLNITSANITQNDIDVSGASNLNISQINSGKINIEGSGASKLTIAGKAELCNIELSGATSADLSNLIFPRGTVDISGCSKLNLNKKSGIDKLETSGASSIMKN